MIDEDDWGDDYGVNSLQRVNSSTSSKLKITGTLGQGLLDEIKQLGIEVQMSDEKGAVYKTPVPANFIEDNELIDLEMAEYDELAH